MFCSSAKKTKKKQINFSNNIKIKFHNIMSISEKQTAGESVVGVVRDLEQTAFT